jgi:hypothetical protein
MELVGAPVTELKALLTQSFEDWSKEGRSCALSGGATALIFLGALRNATVDWRKIILFWADERAVPPDDPDSNYGLAERMLLSPLAARAPRAIRMPAERTLTRRPFGTTTRWRRSWMAARWTWPSLASARMAMSARSSLDTRR